MKFTGSFTTATINLTQFENMLKEHLETELKKVANVWLTAVTDLVPVWSGMSQGSLLELRDLINGRLIISPVSGVKSRIPQGRSLGTAILNTDLNDFNITITTDVPHYNIQEYVNVNVSPSAPWRSLEAGAVAAYPLLKSVRLIAPIITGKQIKV
jgi:hypothetical protein